MNQPESDTDQAAKEITEYMMFGSREDGLAFYESLRKAFAEYEKLRREQFGPKTT